MKPEGWSFEDGPIVAARIKHEYAELLLSLLPQSICIEESVADALVDAYRALTRTSLQAVRRCRAEAHGPATHCSGLRRKSNAIAAALRLVHLQLVALHLSSLEEGNTSADTLELVLQAERSVEALVDDVEL